MKNNPEIWSLLVVFIFSILFIGSQFFFKNYYSYQDCLSQAIRTSNIERIKQCEEAYEYYKGEQ